MTDASSKAAGRVLLPSHVVPVRYDLAITPDLEAFTFAGKVTIELSVDAAKLDDSNATSITLHAKELCFSSAEYTVGDDPSSSSKKAEQIHVDLKATTVKFVFAKEDAISSETKTLKLTISYFGFLNNQMAGFYRSSYTDIHGVSKIMASTQFEALDARRAFPCFDEPACKAIFSLSLTVPSHLQCVSNMPTARVDSAAKTKTWQFLDTPKMSTYLLAFIVGELDSMQARTLGGVLVQVYTPPGQAHLGQFALDTAVKCLDIFDKFFETPYPLAKLDMCAISEFAAGAMENWGLVTYRMVDLLIDPLTASSQQKQRVATVVCHELAHMWFGDYVTMTWWDDLWLNEGFASWAENYAGHLIYPEFSYWDQFTVGALSAALRLDALKSSHPIQVPIAHAEEVEQVFDAISYCKGGAVVRMIRAVLGASKFQEGLVMYMKKHAYGNTETYDLWNAWETASQMPVGEMMQSWTEQMGFPLVRVVGEEWKEGSVTLELDQMWFLADGSELDEEGKSKKWTIPIISCTDSGAQEDMVLMRETTATMTIPITAGGWVKLNAGQEVPMRVLVSKEMLKRLAPAIKSKALSTIDRASLVNDAYALVKARHMEPEALIELLGNYAEEDSYIVWQGLSDALCGLDTILSDDSEMSKSFTSFAKKMVVNLMKKVGWESQDTDGHLTTLLRSLMISMLSTFASDDSAVMEEAEKRYHAFQQDAGDVQSFPSDMRSQVFKIILKNGGEKEYNFIKSYYYSATDNAERKHVLNSLGSIQDSKLKLATMEWTTSGEIKLQDFFYAMGSVGRSSRAGREISWQYFQDNFEKIKSMLGKAGASLMDACIVMCAGGFCSFEKADEIDAFFASHPLPQNTRKIAQTTEAMRTNAKFFAILKASKLSSEAFWAALEE